MSPATLASCHSDFGPVPGIQAFFFLQGYISGAPAHHGGGASQGDGTGTHGGGLGVGAGTGGLGGTGTEFDSQLSEPLSELSLSQPMP